MKQWMNFETKKKIQMQLKIENIDETCVFKKSTNARSKVGKKSLVPINNNYNFIIDIIQFNNN